MKTTRKLLFLCATAAGGAYLYAWKRPRYSGIKLKQSIIIDRGAAELYEFWRDFENLPKIADILDSVHVIDSNRSRWTVTAPGGIKVQWDAEITKDVENEMIGWRSTPDSTIETAGYVRFERAPGGRGTLVRVAMEYDLPGGKIGAAVAAVIGKRPGGHIEVLLRRFKQLMETGEIAVAQMPAKTKDIDSSIQTRHVS
jgi:uncharacterized membrane protein